MDKSSRRDPAAARLAVLAACLTATLLAATALAWACIPQPKLVTVQPRSSGPTGSQVTVSGLGFDAGRAEVRWNAADGELLAASNGPDFSVDVTIPQAPDGLYHLIVLSRSPGGEIGNTGAASFQVTSADGRPGSSNPPTTAAPATADGDSDGSTSTADLLLSAAVGAGVALACIGGALLLGRRSPRPAQGTTSSGR